MNFEGTVFCKSSSNIGLWSQNTILKALLCMTFLWLFNFCMSNIQTTGPQENFDVMKALRRSFHLSNFKENAILAKAFSFWLAFLQRDLTWSSNVTLLSLMDTQLSCLLLEMAIPPMLI